VIWLRQDGAPKLLKFRRFAVTCRDAARRHFILKFIAKCAWRESNNNIAQERDNGLGNFRRISLGLLDTRNKRAESVP
jgi:hypothetical protein